MKSTNIPYFQVEMKGKGKLLTFWLVREDPPDHPEDEYNEGGSVFTEDETNISHWEIEATPDADDHTETEGEEKFWRECETLEGGEDIENNQKLSLDFCKESDKHMMISRVKIKQRSPSTEKTVL